MSEPLSAQSDKMPPPVIVEQAFCPECGMPASIDGYRMCLHVDVEDTGVEIVRYVLEAELETARADLHQVHLNYHHMVDVAQALRKALDDALDLAAEGIDYTPEYFVKKWKMDDKLARLRAVLDGAAPDQSRLSSEENDGHDG